MTVATRARPGRVALMRTAIGLMGQHGYEGTSTRDIASAAGVSVAALYYHFPSKLDLLREFLHEAHDVVVARLGRELEAAGDDPRHRLDVAVATIISSSMHSDWARLASHVAWREIGRLEKPEQQAIAAKRAQMADMIRAVIADGVRARVFSTRDPLAVAQAVLTLCISVVDPYADTVRPMDQVIALNQRFAAALADTPGPARRKRNHASAR